MHKLVLFCKSYSGDLERCKNLSESIKEHNKDDIPFYISVPKSEKKLFEDHIPHFTEILVDEDVTDNNRGWVGQQYVKAMFYKHKLSRFYMCVDSDSYFIRDFDMDDFMWDEDTPYMVMHESVAFYEFMDRFEDLFPFDARQDHIKEYRSIRAHLRGDGHGKIYDYAPGPFVWDTVVWERLDIEYGISELFKKHHNELKWYGEAVLKYGSNYMPSGPLFKAIHYEQQYEYYKQLGYEEKHFKKQYLGIGMQSNWNAPLRY